jgi:nicotinamide mononucleotide transporter
MTDTPATSAWLEAAAAALAAMSWLEAAAVAFGLAYLVLAIRQNMLCWAAALVSVLLSLVLFYQARLYSESALQVFYAAMAFYGWYQWRYGGRRAGAATDELPVGVWPLEMHVVAIGGTLAASALLGFFMDRKTDAELPYLDAFTTVAAIVTTYMVAKKLLENWVYWLVIDSLSVYIYVARGLSALGSAGNAGATITKPGQATPWGGYSGYFSDPEGFLWEAVHVPGFRIDGQGRLRLPE